VNDAETSRHFRADTVPTARSAYLRWFKLNRDQLPPATAAQAERCALHIKCLAMNDLKVADVLITGARDDFRKLEEMLGAVMPDMPNNPLEDESGSDEKPHRSRGAKNE
jgi:hypothetical protein